MVWRYWIGGIEEEYWKRRGMVCLQSGLELLIEGVELVCHRPVWGIKVGLVGHWKSFVVWTAYCTVTLSLCHSDFYFFIFLLF